MEDFEKTRANRNGGKIFHESHSENKLEAIKKLVTTFNDQGRRKRYSILVDSELIVPPTVDEERFDDYLDFVDHNTEAVEIRLYFGDSPNCNRYFFHFKEFTLQALGNIPKVEQDVDSQIQIALERQSLETEVVALRKKVKKLKRKLTDAEEKLGDKGVDMKDLLSQGMQLYGHLSNKGGVPPVAPVHGLPEKAEVEIEEEEQSEADKFYEELKEQYSEQQLERALKTWEVFTKYPELRQEFYSIIHLKANQNGEA